MSTPMGPGPQGPIDVSVPADRDFVSAIRAVARSAAVLSDLDVDDVEDIQLAVDEAATLLLPIMDGAALLNAAFDVGPGLLCVTLSARCRADAEPDTEGLPWMMLTGLDPDVEITSNGPTRAIVVRRSRSGAEA